MALLCTARKTETSTEYSEKVKTWILREQFHVLKGLVSYKYMTQNRSDGSSLKVGGAQAPELWAHP